MPFRTCIGCLEKRPQGDLIRLGEGRGAYLCANRECFEKAMKRKAFARAFRNRVTLEEIDDHKKEFAKRLEQKIPPPAGSDGYGSR